MSAELRTFTNNTDDTAAWRVANQANGQTKSCSCTGKSSAKTPAKVTKATPEQAERQRILSWARGLTAAAKQRIYKALLFEETAAPDPYAAALEARRKEYADDRPKTYEEAQ